MPNKDSKIVRRILYLRKKRLYKRRYRQKQSWGAFSKIADNVPFKPYMNTKFQYVQTVTVSSGVGGIYGTESVFRLNSLYDPFFNLGGHQPYGFNQMEALYRRYMVNAVKIQLVLTDPSTDSIVVGVTLQPSGSSVSLTGKSVDVVKEQLNSITRVVNDSGSQTKVINQYSTIPALEGLKRSDLSLSQYSALMTTDPDRSPFLRIAACHLAGTEAANIRVRVCLTFSAKLFDRITFAQSN